MLTARATTRATVSQMVPPLTSSGPALFPAVLELVQPVMQSLDAVQDQHAVGMSVM